MDIKNNEMENMCFSMRDYFSHNFDWNDIDFNYSLVDVNNKVIKTLSTNYEWVLMYWNDDLDLHINERLVAGVQYWSNYSKIYQNTLSKIRNGDKKIDLCTKYDNLFEIFSINTNKDVSTKDMLTLHKWRPTIADYAYRVWNANQDVILPLRAEINVNENKNDTENSEVELLDTHQYMRFGNIRFTRKEILTIRLILSHRKIKEISTIQGCSENCEHRRIQRIKEKLGCPHASSSGLFNALKEHGITLACLETLVSYP